MSPCPVDRRTSAYFICWRIDFPSEIEVGLIPIIVKGQIWCLSSFLKSMDRNKSECAVSSLYDTSGTWSMTSNLRRECLHDVTDTCEIRYLCAEWSKGYDISIFDISRHGCIERDTAHAHWLWQHLHWWFLVAPCMIWSTYRKASLDYCDIVPWHVNRSVFCSANLVVLPVNIFKTIATLLLCVYSITAVPLSALLSRDKAPKPHCVLNTGRLEMELENHIWRTRNRECRRFPLQYTRLSVNNTWIQEWWRWKVRTNPLIKFSTFHRRRNAKYIDKNFFDSCSRSTIPISLYVRTNRVSRSKFKYHANCWYTNFAKSLVYIQVDLR